MMQRPPYPASPREEAVDVYHGLSVADPYRWLEDPDSPRARAWIEAQNKVTEAFLEKIPARMPLRERLTQLWNFERYGLPVREADRYFYSHNDGLQNQSVIYTLVGLDGAPKELLDPNKMSQDGTVALSGYAPSRDGAYLAYGTSEAGSDWQRWRIRDSATADDLDDELRWVKFSGVSWTADGKGLYYSRYDEPTQAALRQPNFYQKLYFHRLGSPQSEDRLIFEKPDQKEWGFRGTVSRDGGNLAISVWRGTDRKNGVFFASLRDGAVEGEVAPLLDDFDASYQFIGNDRNWWWFLTDRNAPRGKVVAINVRNPEPRHWVEVIGESDETLEDVNWVGERLICRYLKDAQTQVRICKLDGTLERELKLPGLGTASGFFGRPEDPETFFAYSSYHQPPTIYRLNSQTGHTELFREPKVAFDPAAYESRQFFYESKDGVRVPIILTGKKPLEPTGEQPTYLYGYGGFSISLTPGFSPTNLLWMENGGLLAVPNLRGGGEYGEQWHQAGMLANKQNVFDDFIAAAEWLIDKRYTKTAKLAAAGRSNGGLLVAACMVQRPDLFGAVLPGVGVLDMLRFHKFTIGWAWMTEYGSPDDPGQFPTLFAYSPYHNLRPGTAYPATLLTTADHDDRVVPAHSFKFAAALQHTQAGHAPVLIRIETRAGHGAGKPTAKIIEESADSMAFVIAVLEVNPPVAS